MLYEYAMTPDIFHSNFLDTNDTSGIILVEILRGLAQFGVLANLNRGSWIRYVEPRVNTLSPALKDKVLSCLKILKDRNRLVKHPKSMTGDPSSDCDWLKLALVSHDRIPFHAIILSQALIDNCKYEISDFVEYSVALDSSQWNDCKKRTLTLTKSSADYSDNLAPVLRYARKLALVDPYLKCSKRYIDTISICSNLLGDRGHNRLKCQFEIHASADKQNPHHCIGDCLAEWERKLQSLADKDQHKFRVYLWESKPGSESMHDRYILTDQCGLLIPGGLDCRVHSYPNSTDWSLVDENVRQNRWADYDHPASPFNLLERTEICPNPK